MTEKDPADLSLEEIEEIEKLTLRWVFQAVLDFGMEAHEIFIRSPDSVKDIAEDITRELLDRLSGFNVQQRIYGNVDYKRARYVILPEQTVRQALFIDSKAEKENRSATIQMSQTSMWIKQRRSGNEVNEKGSLSEISKYGGKNYLTTHALSISNMVTIAMGYTICTKLSWRQYQMDVFKINTIRQLIMGFGWQEEMLLQGAKISG